LPELTLPSRLSGASEYTVPSNGEINYVREPGFRVSRRKPRTQLDPKLRRQRRIIMAMVVVAVLVVLIVPSVFAAMTALSDYSSLKALGLNGVEHLVAAKADLSGEPLSHGSSSACSVAASPTATVSGTSGSSKPTSSTTSSLSIPTAAELQSAQTELKAAQSNFKSLQFRMAHPDWVMGAGGAVPGVKSDVSEVSALANTGYDISTMGIELINAATPVLNRLHGHAVGSAALMTQSDLSNLQHAVNNSLTLLADVQAQLSHISVSSLPICAGEKAEFTKLSGELPQAQRLLTQGSQLIQPLGWLLGVGQPSHFLLQTLDDTELRPTGGFTGEFGILTIDNGKIEKPTLYNVDLIDYRAPAAGGFTNNWNLGNGAPFGRAAPPAYSWWEIPNWGLRDSNLNADFPTDAKLVLGVFKDESTDPALVSLGSQQIDGLINITPTAIGNVLKVIGPLYVPGYNVTVTAANLVSLIHYYQLTAAGEAENLLLFPKDGTVANARKRFAQEIAQLLEAEIPKLPLSELMSLAKQAMVDIQAHNIGVYLTNPTLENLLISHQAAGQITSPQGVDGVTVVHTNWSAGKVNSHVNVNQVDNVTLDNKGGATHNMTIAINDYYAQNPTGDFVTYYDYVRVYVPPTAKLLNASGFMCVTPQCSATPYPGGQMVCSGGSSSPGPRTYTRLGSDRDPKLYYAGYPTETTSDVPGRAMWGGNVVVPMGCTATITLSWYVPNIAATSTSTHPAGSKLPYALLVQREGGTFYGLEVILHPAPKVPSEGTKTVDYTLTSDTDYTFTFGEKPQAPPPINLP
jgi:Protein of unknown function (DUF4012)